MFQNALADMLFYFAVVVGIFTFGDILASVTKAKLSTVFVTLMTFLILFLFKVIPADIIDQAGLTAASKWAMPILVFHLGTMINLRQFIDEWRTVCTSWIGMLAVIVGVLCVIPIIGRETALVAIPVVNGALPATQIMTQAAMDKGLPLAAALASVVFAVQKFVGTPFVSRAGVQEARRLIEQYRTDKAAGLITASGEKAVPAAGDTGPEKVRFCEKFSKYYTSNACIFLSVAGGLCAVLISMGIKDLTGVDINYSITGLILSVILSSLGVVPKNILDQGKTSGFITMVVFAAVIPALATISLSDLGTLLFQVVVVFIAAVAAVFLFLCVLPGWKLLGSKSLAFGVGLTQMLGFPSTYLVSTEVANAVAETEDERQYLMSRITPRFVVGGLAAMLSVMVAGVMSSLL